MQLYKYRLFIIIFFMAIFVLKMAATAVPVFLCPDSCNEKQAIIADLQQDYSLEVDANDLLKDSDYKHTDFHYSYVYILLLQNSGIKNCFIDHYKRYVDQHYPAVPTPPPNSIVI